MEGRLIILDQFNDRREHMNSEILELEKKEFVKRDIELDFIASQNLCSEDILDACSSISQMKYAE